MTPCFPWSHGQRPINFKLSGFLANGHLPRVSHQSRLSANDMGDNKMVPAVDEVNSHRIKWDSILPNEADCMLGEKEGKKERRGRGLVIKI